jgi:hypothetical protein
VAYWCARAVLENPDLAVGLKVAAALIPVPIFALFLLLFIRLIRTLDELERRIQLEALAIAYPLAVLLLMTLGLLQRAVQLPFEDWSYAHVWMYVVIFYFLSIPWVARRYQ